MVFAMPQARVAVMGPAGKEFVYKDEIRAADAAFRKGRREGRHGGRGARERDAKLAELSARYERDLMNPKEALSLG